VPILSSERASNRFPNDNPLFLAIQSSVYRLTKRHTNDWADSVALRGPDHLIPNSCDSYCISHFATVATAITRSIRYTDDLGPECATVWDSVFRPVSGAIHVAFSSSITGSFTHAH